MVAILLCIILFDKLYCAVHAHKFMFALETIAVHNYYYSMDRYNENKNKKILGFQLW